MTLVLAQTVINTNVLAQGSLELFSEGTNLVFSYNRNHVIKIYPPCHRDQFNSELLVLQHIAGKLSIKTPIVQYQGEIENWPYLIMSQLEGQSLETLWETLEYSNKIIVIRELGLLIKEIHALSTMGLEAIDCDWKQWIERQLQHCSEQHRVTRLPRHLLQELPNYVHPIKERLIKIKKSVILTGEYTPMNILVKRVNRIWRIHGLIDFGDAMLGAPEYDLLGPAAFLVQGDKQLLREFLLAYGYAENELTLTLSHQLMALLLLHRYSNLSAQIRIKD
jgi:hygromycin-B 7''-O-kinase